MQIDTNAINCEINMKLAAMHAETPKAKVRRLPLWDYTQTLDHAIAAMVPGEDRIILRDFGGYVCNSYGSRADGDRLDVEINTTTGAVKVSAARAYAPKTPHGGGKCLAVQIIREGKIRGRYI